MLSGLSFPQYCGTMEQPAGTKVHLIMKIMKLLTFANPYYQFKVNYKGWM